LAAPVLGEAFGPSSGVVAGEVESFDVFFEEVLLFDCGWVGIKWMFFLFYLVTRIEIQSSFLPLDNILTFLRKIF
jgi:hypothetical protein